MCVADLASEVFDSVHLYAPDDGEVWLGARRARQVVRRFASPSDIVDGLGVGDGLLFVWAIKPLSTSWGAAQAIKRALPTSLMALDIDDADEALSSQFRAASPLNRLRLHPWSPLNPRKIRTTLASALREVDAVTYASEALKSTLGIVFDGPMLRIPHPRRRASPGPSSGSSVSDRIHLGFLGTIRQHKGLGNIEALVLGDPRYVLHVFQGSLPLAAKQRLSGQVIEHDVDAPMEEIYADVDVVVLPQDRSPGAAAQLPAKLLDAMRLGKPTVASASATILEAAADTVLYVDDWESMDEVQRMVSQANATGSTLGLRARRRFDERLALETQVAPLRAFVRATAAHSDVRETS
jgi:glycosyltransferase involved in cell wall biosynthesis